MKKLIVFFASFYLYGSDVLQKPNTFKHVLWSIDKKICVSKSENTIQVDFYNDSNEKIKSIKFQPFGCKNLVDNKIFSICLSPDAKFIAVSTNTTSIEIWDISKKKIEPAKALCPHSGIIYSLAWSPDGKFLASGSAKGKIQIWNLNQSHSYKEFDVHNDLVSLLHWESENKLISKSKSGEEKILEYELC